MRKPKGDVSKLNTEAKTHFEAGRYAEAEALYRKALTIRQADFGAKHSTSVYYHSHLGVTNQKQERYDEATVHFQTALKISKEIEGPISRNAARLLGSLGELHRIQAPYVEAESYLTRALAIYEQLTEPEPLTILWKQRSLAWVHYHLEHYDQAMDLAERTRAEYDRLLMADTPVYMDCLNLLCCLAIRRGSSPAKIPLLRLVKEKLELLGMTNDLWYAVWLGILGSTLLKMQQLAEAEALLRQTIALKRKIGAADDQGFIVNLNGLGMLYTVQERLEDAKPLLAEALQLSRRLLPPNSNLHRVVLVSCARRCYYQERAEEVIALCEEYLRLYEGAQTDETKMMMDCRIMLGRMYGRLGRYWQAEEQLVEAQTVCRAKSGEDSAQYAAILAYLGEWNHFQGRDTEALSFVMKALEIFPRIPVTSNRALKTAQKIAVEILESKGQWREAEALRAEFAEDATQQCPLVDSVDAPDIPDTCQQRPPGV